MENQSSSKQRIRELGRYLNSKETIVVGKTGYCLSDGYGSDEWVETDVMREVYIHSRRERKIALRELRKIRVGCLCHDESDEIERAFAIRREDIKKSMLESVKFAATI